jgi:hypothetical protein
MQRDRLNSDGRTSEMAVLHSYIEIIFLYFLNFNFNFIILISKKKANKNHTWLLSKNAAKTFCLPLESVLLFLLTP